MAIQSGTTDLGSNIGNGTEGVVSLNGLEGALSLMPGTGIAITTSGSNIIISNTEAGGSVTNFSFVNGGGFTGTVTNPTTTPALSLTATLAGDVTGPLTATALTATTNNTLTTLSALSLPGSQVTGNIAGNASNITATSNSTLTTLSALSLPTSQLTGILAIANGGTGLGTAPSNGQLLIGNGTGYTQSTLTAGSGVSITNGMGSVTISATGSGGTVTSVSVNTANGFAGTVTNPTTTPALTLSTTVTGILYGNGTSVAAAVPSNFPTLNQNTTGTAANITATTNSTLTSLPNLVLPASQLSGVVPVSNGGTSNTTAQSARGPSGLNIDERTTVNAVNYTAVNTDRYIAQIGTLTSAGITITLPAANSTNAGQQLVIGDESGTASTSNVITITGAGSDTIDGVASKTIRSAYGWTDLFSNGTNGWFSGTVGVGRGGTGLSALPTNGQLLIGNSTTSSYNLNTLTAGSGVSITNGAGSITLSATGSGGTVTSVSVASANGFAGTVANPTTTPALTLSTSVTGILYGNGTSVAAAVAGNFPTLNQNTTGTAANVTGTVAPANGGTGSTAVPTNGQILIGNGTTYTAAALGTGTNVTATTGAGTLSLGVKGTLLSTTAITAGTTFTTSAGVTSIDAVLVGGGGGGGSANSTATGQGAAGGGGGGGGVVRTGLITVTPSTAYTIAIGAGGAAGAAGGVNNGGNGGNTTLTVGTTTYTANGGNGGVGMAGTAAFSGSDGGPGGAATNGLVNVPGKYGGVSLVNANTYVISGDGSDSAGYGFGGIFSSPTAAGNAGTGHGAGGSGGATINVNSEAGGAGSGGLIVVYQYT